MSREQKPEKDVSSINPQREELFQLKKRYRHDAFCKSNLRDLDKARKFLRLMLKPEIVDLLDLNRLELSPESFLDEDLKKLYSDVLYQIPVKGSDESIVVFVLIELKTESDKWTVFQQTKYIVRIWDQELQKADKEKRLGEFKLPTVIPIIFHHGESKFTAPTELIEQVRVLQGLEQYTLNMKSFLFDVMQLDENDLPKDLELCTLIMVLQAVFQKDVADRLLAIYHKLRPNLNDPSYEKLWQDCLYYATISANKLTTKRYMEIISEIQNTGGTTMSTTVWDQLIEEGRVEGEAKGEARGKTESIILILTKRFSPPSQEIKDRLLALTDLEQIDKLADFAFDCNSVEEFKAALK